MMRGQVQSGGGAHGAFGLGVVYQLRKLGVAWQWYGGTSTGAGLAAMQAQDAFDELLRQWFAITSNDDIFRSGVTRWLWGIFRTGGLNDPSPVARKLRDALDWNKTKHTLQIAVVNMQTGGLEFARPGAPLDRWTLASMSFIPAFPPVEVLPRVQYTDGGNREIAPLRRAIKDGCDEIDVIVNTTLEVARTTTMYRGLKSCAERGLTIALNEIAINDVHREIDRIDLINKVVNLGGDPGDGRTRIVKAHLYEPERLVGGTLEFNRDVIRRNFDHGREIVTRLS